MSNFKNISLKVILIVLVLIPLGLMGTCFTWFGAVSLPGGVVFLAIGGFLLFLFGLTVKQVIANWNKTK